MLDQTAPDEETTFVDKGHMTGSPVDLIVHRKHFVVLTIVSVKYELGHLPSRVFVAFFSKPLIEHDLFQEACAFTIWLVVDMLLQYLLSQAS